jgi:hypothetical protein
LFAEFGFRIFAAEEVARFLNRSLAATHALLFGLASEETLRVVLNGSRRPVTFRFTMPPKKKIPPKRDLLNAGSAKG